MTARRDVLIDEARKMLVGTRDVLCEMKLIDALQRLGISYHFQEEIHASLEKLSSVEFNEESFHEISLQFRLLRQERHYISCGNTPCPPVFLRDSPRLIVQYIGQESHIRLHHK
jgi:hypothetical protein